MHSSTNPVTPRYRLVIFDMDGTLTEELLDFAAIRREIGLPEKSAILETILGMPGPERRHAEEILHRHEMNAAQRCILRPGALEVLAGLRDAGIRTALLTRNSAACTRSVLARHGLSLDVVATRDDKPHKPHPDAIGNIRRRWGILPEQTLMVGDYLYDVQAATNAGVDCALLVAGDGPPPDFAAGATYVVRTLSAVADLVLPTKHEGLKTMKVHEERDLV